MAPDAGSRRMALKYAAALLSGGWGIARAAPPPRPAGALQALFSVAGARLLAHPEPTGNALREELGPYVPLIFPVAVAGSFGDLYIADAGVSRLYRYDRGRNAFAVIPNVRIGPNTRLQTGPDGSLYVLDPFSSRIDRFTRGGTRLTTFHPRQPASRYSDFVVHPLSGRLYAVDSAYLCIDEIEPLGNIAIERLRIEEPGPVAITDRGILYLGGANCGCVNEWIEGRSGRRFAAGKLRLPRALAVIGPQIVGLDGERNIVLIHEEGMDKIAPRPLGLLAPEGIAAAQGLLLVADGAGQRVTAFRPVSA
ncbi:MAG: hypothetical protein M0P39_03075 [Rhodocyclaceae bacterium]|nr:hypothetical protein [Rhodocyclaceae bacterium]